MKTYKENTLYHLANKNKDQIISEEEILQNDLTQTFFEELEYMIKNGEIIIININAKMRLGKSTQAIALGQHIHGLLKKHGQQPKNAEFTINNIARDQQEHSKMMRDPNLCNTVLVIDESNELENTGENVTIEQSMRKVFSDVQAGRYVHGVFCSPKQSVDQNADIHLQITGIDKHTKTTFNKLYYKFFEGGIERIILIGHVKISVKKLIHNWEKHVKKIFQKTTSNTETKNSTDTYATKTIQHQYHKNH